MKKSANDYKEIALNFSVKNAKIILFSPVFVTITLLFLMILPKCAIAQLDNDDDIFKRFEKPMPAMTLLPKEKFEEATRLIEKRPYDNDDLAYSIRIPKDWTEGDNKVSSTFVLSDKLFLELDSYYGAPTIFGRNRITVEALQMKDNITAEEWYMKYILEGGYTTEGWVVHSKNRVESLMIVMEGDYSYCLRSIVTINGDNVIMIKYYIPLQYFKEKAVMQAMVVSSFEMTYPRKHKINPMHQYRFLDIAELEYPSNWKIYPKPMRDTSKLEASVFKDNESSSIYGSKTDNVSVSDLTGVFNIKIVSLALKNTIIDEIDDYKKRVESKGMLIDKRILEDFKFKYSDKIDFAITEIYKVLDSGSSSNEYELWFSLMVGGNYYYIVSLLTPSRNNNFGVWAENTENYKLMIPRFKLMSGAFLNRD